MSHAYICNTCGVQYTESQNTPEACVICEEERQYVLSTGQSWTTLEKMRSSNEFYNEIVSKEEGVYAITTKPSFGIGQTAYLVKGKTFNILWDCITYIDGATIKSVRELGV